MNRLLIGLMVGIALFLTYPVQAKDALASDRSSVLESFGVQKVEEKKEALPFSLKDLNGNQVALKDFRGKPVLLLFWASWCPSCCEEIPYLEKLYQEKKHLLTVVGLAIDGEKEKKIRNLVKENNISFPVLLDPKEKTARAYGIKFIPNFFLIDPSGMIVAKIVGERDWSSPDAWTALKEIFHLR
jgi:peroxiredoxin